MTYDRAEIMRHAHRLRREQGMTLQEAMKTAWAMAKQQIIVPRQQEAGMWAALRRYGFDPDRLTVKVKNCIVLGMQYIHRLNQRRKTPRISKTQVVIEKWAYGDSTLNARRGRDGVWRVPEIR